MLTLKNSVTAKRALAFVILTMACIMCFPGNSIAQKQIKVKLGNIDSNSVQIKTILANPVLSTNEPGCEVVKFSLMILPAGGEIQGPYTRTGSRIGDNQLSMLKEFTNTKVRVFIDDVYVKCNGRDTTKVQGIALAAHP